VLALATALGTILLAVEPAAASSQQRAADDEAGAAVETGEVDTQAGETAGEAKGGQGVSPVELVPRLELRQAFTKGEGGVASHDTTLEMDIQFLRRLLLRYEVPARILETPAGQVSGIGDLQIKVIGIVSSSPRTVTGFIVGAELDTATQPTLGAGKQQLLLGLAGAWKPFRFWLTYLVLQDQFSVAGQSARPDVHEFTGDFGNILFGRQFNWLKLDLTTTVDFPGGATGRLYGLFEVGSLVIGRVGLFSRLGTQLAGPRLVDYTVVAGVRYLFRLETARPAAPER
jgi:hypothetical protein